MSARPDMRVKIGGLRMKNPVMVASGTFGYGPEYAGIVDLNKLGAIVVKGIGRRRGCRCSRGQRILSEHQGRKWPVRHGCGHVSPCDRGCTEADRSNLAPNTSDITVFAKAAEECGADAISLINSYPAMAIDIEKREPILANKTGGLSGPAIHPIAVRLVWQASQAVSIPVIGIGGITSAEDALEFIIVGATAVQVGTANFTHPPTALEVVEGLRAYLQRHGLDRLDPLVGSIKA